MHYSIQKQEDTPIVMVEIGEEYSKGDVESYLKELRKIYDEAKTPIYQILDVRKMKLKFDDIMEDLKAVITCMRELGNHPMNKDTLVVTDSRFYQMMVKGLTSTSFGHLQIQIFETMEAAMLRVQE